MRSKQPTFGQIAAIVRYLPPKASTACSHALSGVVGHKMTTGTKVDLCAQTHKLQISTMPWLLAPV
jgi:hypothetical protein